MKKILVKDGAFYVYDAPNSENSENGEWITLENGEHVKTNNGEIVAGAGGALNGVKVDGGNGSSSGRNDPKEFKLKSGKTITRGKPMSHEEASKGANPHYGSSPYYNENCQSCVMAYELRLRGYNVEAKGRNVSLVFASTVKDPSKEFEKGVNAYQHNLANNQALGWKDSSVNTPKWTEDASVNTPKRAGDFLNKNIKEGERHFLSMRWKGGGSHIIAVSKDNSGNLVAHDPQNNVTTTGIKEIRAKYLDRLAYKGMMGRPPKLLRVDNLTPNSEYVENVVIGSGDKEDV